MSVTLTPKENFEIQTYKKPRNIRELRKTHAPYSGAPQKHPYDSGRVVIVTDPYASNAVYYEFMADDIDYVEELPNLVDIDGDTVTMVRIWVKKQSLAIQCTPFIVDDLNG